MNCGFVHVKLAIEHPSNRAKRRDVELLVDTGALYSFVPFSILRQMDVEEQERAECELADERPILRGVGEIRFLFDGRRAVSPVIFGEEGDAEILGVVTMEAMGLEVDPVRKQIRPIHRILY